MKYSNIDERVVEMRFDNKEFESRVKGTMSILDKLKESLNMTESAKTFEVLDRAANEVSLQGIASAVESLQERFSTFGIVGMRIIENITDSITGKLMTAIGFVSDSIVSGGIKRAMNIENAHFQLQALLKDEELVQQYMDAAMKSVDGTAYAYDEAAKAASQFAASGVQAGEDVLTALRGITGVAAMTNSDYEGIARIFNTIAGNGRLMGDQLLQLSSRGMNAAATIADYFKEVRKQSGMTEAKVREMVSDGEISFKIFADAMDWAFGESAFRANETFTGAFANMKSALARIGAGFFSPLIEQNSEVVKLFNALRERINDVKKALVFDESIGNVNALSKQFTDTVLSMSKNATELVKNMDLSTPIQIFYFGLESIKNVAKGLYSVLEPIGNAFRDTFSLKTSTKNLLHFTARLEYLTHNLKLSDKNAKNLRDTFKGIFDISKTLTKIIISLVKAIIPINKPVRSLSELLLEITGSMGRSLSKFSEWLTTSQKVAKAYDYVRNSIQRTMETLSKFISGIRKFFMEVGHLPEVEKFVENIRSSFYKLINLVSPYFNRISGDISRFKDEFLNFIPKESFVSVDSFLDSINTLFANINKIDVSKAVDNIQRLIEKIKSLGKSSGENNGAGMKDFVQNITNFVKNLQDGFSVDNLFSSIDAFQTRMTKFVDWIRKTLSPAFEDFNINSALAAGAGIGFIYSFTKIANSIESLSKKISNIPGVIGALKNTLVAYQQDLKANALIKVAGAIAILAGAILLLSFADIQKVNDGAVALAIIAGAFLIGIAKLTEAVKTGKTVEDSLYVFSKNLGKSIKQLATGVKWKLIGSAIKDFGATVLMVAASIALIAYIYKKDSTSFTIALTTVGLIAAVIFEIVVLMSLVGDYINSGVKNFFKIAASVAVLAASLYIIIVAMNKLFKLSLPKDWAKKFAIFNGILISLAMLTLTIALAGKLAGGGKFDSTGLISAAAATYLIVLSLNRLFKMDLPRDWAKKFLILNGIFAAFAVLITTIGVAGAISGGKSIKAASTILAMAVFVAAIVGALLILSLIPSGKMISGSIALGIVIVSLGGSLALASKIVDVSTFKSILAMAVAVGTITGSLVVLSLLKWSAILKSSISLGVILSTLAVNFSMLGKIKASDSYKTVLSMIVILSLLTGSLYLLSNQPWKTLITSAVSMSIVLLAFSNAMKILSATRGIHIDKIISFLGASTILFPIAIALEALADKPWSGMIASGIAIGIVLKSFAETMKIISATRGIQDDKIWSFLKGTLALLPIAASLYFLAKQPWSGMIASGIAISAVLLVYAAVFDIISVIKPKPEAIGLFALGILAVLGIAGALLLVSKVPWQTLLAAGLAISTVLLAMSGAMVIATLAGLAGAPALIGIAFLDLFIANFALVLYKLGSLCEDERVRTLITTGASVLAQIGTAIGEFVGNIVGGALAGISNSFPKIGTNLSEFIDNAQPFFDKVSILDENAVKGTLRLSEMILLLTAASFIDGIASFLSFGSGGIVAFGKKLAGFAEGFSEYCRIIDEIDVDMSAVESSANAAKLLAEMVRILPSEGGWLENIFGTKNLSNFTSQLAELGPALVSFAEETSGLTKDNVQGAIEAVELLSEMAKGLPGQNGWVQKIFGEHSLSEFAQQLDDFGPSIVSFAETVKDVKKSSVKGAAGAAQIMSDMANTLPNSNGFAQQIFGDKNLSDFGYELVRFAPSITLFAEYVKDVKKSSVKGAAGAAQIMSDLANSLPSVDGWSQRIFGDKNLSDFGYELVKFGPSIAVFAEYVKDVSADDVSGVAEALETIIGISSGIEKEGGIIQNISDFLFGGSGVETFGENLKIFGNSFKAFYDNIADINAETLNSVVSEMENLINFMASLDGLSGSGVTTVYNFTIALSGLAENGIRVLAESFQNGKGQVVSAISLLTTEMIEAFETELTSVSIRQAGYDCVNTLVLGANSAETFMQASFSLLGSEAMISLVTGINIQKTNVRDSATRMAIMVKQSFTNILSHSAFFKIGEDIAYGLRDGINSKIREISNAAIEAAREIINATKSELQINSPSKIGIWAGSFWDEGLAQGILGNRDVLEQASKKAMSSIIDTTNYLVQEAARIIENGEEIKPVISPVLDLSNIDRDTEKIQSYFGNDFAMRTYEGALRASSNVKQSRLFKERAQEETETENRRIGDLLASLKDGKFGPTFQNTFHIQSSDPEGVANEVSRIIQRQVERRSQVWE